MVPELLITCFEFLESNIILKVISMVCKQWYQLCKSDSIWRELTFGELEWPKPTSGKLYPPKLPFKNQSEDISWKDFFRLLKGKAKLEIFCNTHHSRNVCEHLIKRILGMDLEECTVQSDDDDDERGIVTIANVSTLIQCLKAKVQLMNEQNQVLSHVVCPGKYLPNNNHKFYNHV